MATSRAAVEVVAPQVRVVDDTGFPKDGKASACVARRYPGTFGKVANCQIAVTVHAATDTASAVLNWRLFLPESWDEGCVPGPDGKPVNVHARRLRQQPVIRDQAGAKKPHTGCGCRPPSRSRGSAAGGRHPRSPTPSGTGRSG